eukprot:UN21613
MIGFGRFNYKGDQFLTYIYLNEPQTCTKSLHGCYMLLSTASSSVVIS